MAKVQINQMDSDNTALIGRQSIYNSSLDIFGYELLYRPSANSNSAEGNFDGNVATGEVMLNAFMELGLENLVGEKIAFINLTEDFILGDIPIAFNPNSIVLEVLEDIDPTPEVLLGIKCLKERGFTLALDDFTFEEHLVPIAKLVDIIKVDVLAIAEKELIDGTKQLKTYFEGKLLAEKIENQDEFLLCKKLGFDYYQGYFLEKPIVVKGQKMPTNKVATLTLLSRLQEPSVEYEELELLIKNDPSLSFKLLRYINSSSFNLGSEVSSIKQALVLLGVTTLKRWVTLIALSGSSNRSPDLIIKALSRANMCEQLSITLKLDKTDQYFLVGLFSILDAMLDQKQSIILKQLPLRKELKLALTEKKGNMGKILRCVLAFEQGDWASVKCGSISHDDIQKKYVDSLVWANNQLKGIG